ncbi:hypothetical protein [Palleronia sp.]|uniref:hypothetical protein n=1 Tax=Palleronia sp. TaxID=1940284 RepID=UPI0035C7D0E1
MSELVPFPLHDDDPEWIVDAQEVDNGYSVAILRHDAVVGRAFFSTYPKVTAAALALHLTHEGEVRVLLSPEECGVPA